MVQLLVTARQEWEKKIFGSKKQGFGLIFDIKITKNGERSSSRKKTVSQTLKSSMEKRRSKNQGVKFNLVRCMSKELEILGKNSGPEGARRRKRITWPSPWLCGM